MSNGLFPQTVEYALRLMAHLAVAGRNGSLPSQDLAEATDIPLAYVSKVLRKLVVAGLLESQRGHGGGFRLAKSPSRISFAAIMEAVGYEPEPRACAFGQERCDSENPCLLHPAYAALKERFADWARNTTLTDVRRGTSGRYIL
ncbi:MAG: Rrf2 family transcriptional regulator [Planctomycetota bacterium]|nr:MAG: Rrf2 family transcriptional regulator [Planctomycetota bacterium]